MKHGYTGNARFIEIGSPGVPFRFTVNLDTLEGLRFEEKREVIEVPVPGTGVGEIPLETQEQVVNAGWSVLLLIGGKTNGIDFPTIEPAMACYNAIMSMINAVGVPLVCGTKLMPPEPDPAIVGPDGKAMDAVKAAVAGALEENPTIEAGEAGEDQLDPDLGEDPMLTDEQMEELTKPDADNDG